MRVLQLGPFPPPHGGVQTNLAAIHHELRRRGHTAFVANITSTRRPSDEGVYYPANTLELLELLIRLDYEIIHLHFGGQLSFRLVLLYLVCTLLPGKRTVLTFHSGGYASSAAGRTAGWWTLRGFVFRRFDLIIGVNREIEALFEKFGVSRSRLRIVAPYSTDPRVDQQGGTAFPPVIEDFLTSHTPVLATVGGLAPQYDVPIQLRLLSWLRETQGAAGLLIIGDGSIRDEIKSAICQAGLSEHAMLCGDTPHEVTLEVIRRADVVLRTSKYDGDSIAVRESIALGTPVVASDNGMRPPGVRVFRIGDLDGLCDAVAEALADGDTPVTIDVHDGIATVIELYQALLH